MNATASRNLRADFPFFKANPDIVYLDNSATSQMPTCVMDRLCRYELLERASPLRGMYALSARATEDYEHARELVRGFIGAATSREIIFTRNASESLNAAAYMLEHSGWIRPGDEILVDIAGHHSNLLPWQQLAKRTGAIVRFLLCTADGEYRPEDIAALLTERTKVLAVTHMSNVFGRLVDMKRLCDLAHAVQALVVADGCQSVPHMPVDVGKLGVDFLAFSGHKMLGPTGIGVLYGREELLHSLEPFLFGGEMVTSVSLDGARWAPLPQKFEAGTVNTGGALALGEATRYYGSHNFASLQTREADLTRFLMAGMAELPDVHIIGSPRPEDHHGIVAFTVDGVHPHDVATILGEQGICIRSGYHCAQPLHRHLGLMDGSCRVSLMFYNTESELDRFLSELKTVRKVMGWT